MSIFNIEEVVLCIYENAPMQEKLKLSQLSVKHSKLISTLHKICKTIFTHTINKKYGDYINVDDNYLYLRNNDAVTCIDTMFHKTHVNFKPSDRYDSFCDAKLNNGIIMHSNLKIRYVTFLPKCEEIVLYNKIRCLRIYFFNGILYILTAKEINDKHFMLLSYYHLTNNTTKFIGVLELNVIPSIVGNKDILCISQWDHIQCENKIYKNNEFVCEFNTNNDDISIIDNYILIEGNKNILCSIIGKKLNFNTIYNAPDNYYIICSIKELTSPLTVLILVHDYYNTEDIDESVEAYTEVNENFIPACIVVVLANKTWEVVHREPINSDYTESFHVVGNTVFIEGTTTHKIISYNFNNL